MTRFPISRASGEEPQPHLVLELPWHGYDHLPPLIAPPAPKETVELTISLSEEHHLRSDRRIEISTSNSALGRSCIPARRRRRVVPGILCKMFGK